MTAPRIKLAISSCLLGQEVRYDGGHKNNAWIQAGLTPYFDFVPYCPEVAIGMGVPREPIRLVQTDGDIEAVGVRNAKLNVSAALRDYGQQVAPALSEVSGYIVKKDSPSCGMERVRVFDAQGMPHKRGRGIYTATIMQYWPELPVEEEGRLMDPVLRENFIERVFIYHRWQQLEQAGLSVHGLMEFHRRHKLILLAHDESVYRQLGPRVAAASETDLAEVAVAYRQRMMTALRRPASRKRHTNVLQHILGFFKRDLDADDKQEMLEVLDNYRKGQLPLIVPITLLRHHLRRHPVDWIAEQYYLNPYPQELMLRNSL